MATRQRFLARRMGAPAPKPAPTPRPARPSRPTPRRRPGRPPARPTPRRPAGPAPRPAPRPGVPGPRPSGPLFPRPVRPSRPFGVPRPLVPGPSPLGRGAARRLLRGLAPRLIPGLGLALLAWDAYELYQWWMQKTGPIPAKPPQGYTLVSDCADISGQKLVYSRFSRPCGSRTSLKNTPAEDPWGPWPSMHLWRLTLPGDFGYQPSGRVGVTERWDRNPVGPYGPPEPEVPGFEIPTVPTELPYPYPYSEPPPVGRPRPEPEPAPAPGPLPSLPPGYIPALEWSPSEPGVAPVPHKIAAPTSREREKKKRLKPGTIPAWYKFLAKFGGSFMEIDDNVAAIYKGLPWRLRRWRGRDGVWRDRDHNTKARLERLYSSLGELNVQTAVKELIKQEASDRAWGAVGNALKQRARELGDAGLWSGLRGPGAGTPLNKSQWEAQKRLKQQEWERKLANGEYHNWYRVKEYNPDTNRWEIKLKQRPVVRIPWYRKESFYPRTRRLTGGEGAFTVKAPRYYYAEQRLPRPLIRRPT